MNMKSINCSRLSRIVNLSGFKVFFLFWLCYYDLLEQSKYRYRIADFTYCCFSGVSAVGDLLVHMISLHQLLN